MTWFVKTKDLSDKTIACLLDIGSVKIIGDCYLRVQTSKGMKDKIKNSYGVVKINRMDLIGEKYSE